MSARNRLQARRNLGNHQPLQVDLLARVVNVDPDEEDRSVPRIIAPWVVQSKDTPSARHAFEIHSNSARLENELKRVSPPVIAGLFRARLLKVLLGEGVISQQIVDLLLSWNHHSGFNVHARGRIHGADGKAIEHEPQGMP